jgi:hypothetical protein
VSNNIYALDNFELKGGIINFGIGYQINSPEDYTLEFDFLNFGIKHKNTGIGIEYSFIKMWNWMYKDDNKDINYNETSRISLLNLGVYWNIYDLNFNNNKMRFSFDIFNKINYLLGNKSSSFKFNEYIYSAGLRFGIMFRIGKDTYYNFLTSEIGYRNTGGNNIFYVNVNVEVFGWFIYGSLKLTELFLSIITY